MNARKLCILKRHIRRITIDLALIPFAFYLALFVRLDGHCTAQELETLARHIFPITLVYIAINVAFGIYQRLWAYASFYDIIFLSEVVGFSTLILVAINAFGFSRYSSHCLSTGGLIIGGLFTFILSTIIKYRRQLIANVFIAFWPQSATLDLERVLIVGVNTTAQQLATQICQGRNKKTYKLVGFVDSDPDGQGMNVNGVKILGTLEQIQTLVRKEQIDVIIIAHWPGDRKEMWQLISTCLETTAKIKVLPKSMVQVLEGRYKDPLTLRDINIDDILGRTPIAPNTELCQHFLKDKVVLVTGAAGSIGSELCRQILHFEPRSLLVLDNNETGLYELNLELNQNGRSPLQLIMADITDWRKVQKVFQQYRPQVVFHAAAYKHVHLVESHPDEALRVNVIGTVIVSEMAHECRAERFVFISTDKAVNPSCVMGASKRIGELWIKSLSRHSSTTFITVRFGNVVGSRGSVVPTFARQIELGLPLTVTHPEMRRFFMSIPEAASLVVQAAAFGQSDEIFMLEMGEEVSILDLAHRMIRLKGLRVHKDIEIKLVGVRPGEKLNEELTYDQEMKQKTFHPSIYRLRGSNRPIDHQILLGAVFTLYHALRLKRGEQLVREGIFHIAACDIDTFLNKVTGIDLTQTWRQRLGGTQGEGEREKRIVHSGQSIVGDQLLVPGV